MTILDISQEVFGCKVFPGNPGPEHQFVKTLAAGGTSNLSFFSMCAHNGTHVDAPFHFLPEGRTIDQMGLEPFVGFCWVSGRRDGPVGAAQADEILQEARDAGASERILIAGSAVILPEGARRFAEAGGVKLVGNESQTVGPEDCREQRADVHRTLLAAGIVILEGAVLDGVAPGKYFLSAAPLNLGGSDGAPCRAYLIPAEEFRP